MFKIFLKALLSYFVFSFSTVFLGEGDASAVTAEENLLALLIGITFFLYLVLKPKTRSDIKCTWCGSKKMKYLEGERGKWFWEYRNKDGSQDKRASDNFQKASFRSKQQCKKCNAVSRYTHYVAKKPSKAIEVYEGELDTDGVGVRKKKNYYIKGGTSINTRGANRKNNK